MSTVLFTGGLGNQLFQYTFMLYLKEIEKQNVSYNLSSIPFYHAHSGFEADKVFDFSDFTENRTNYYSLFYRGARKVARTLLGKSLFCDDKAYAAKHAAQVYEGFWMDQRYYAAVKQHLLEKRKDLSGYCGDDAIKQHIMNTNAVFIHVRRGDYVSNSAYCDLSQTRYYQDAIACMQSKVSNPVFFVFSDDIAWCKQYFADDEGMNFVQYEGQSTLGDLSLMLMCKHAILANSTFSWWGAALDTKQIVIRPSEYFGNRQQEALYPAEWIAINAGGEKA